MNVCLDRSFAVSCAFALATAAGCSKSRHDTTPPTPAQVDAAAQTEKDRAREHIAKIEKKFGKNHREAKALRDEYDIRD